MCCYIQQMHSKYIHSFSITCDRDGPLNCVWVFPCGACHIYVTRGLHYYQDGIKYFGDLIVHFWSHGWMTEVSKYSFCDAENKLWIYGQWHICTLCYWFVICTILYCDYVTLRQMKQIFKTFLSKPLGGATQRHLRQCCSYLLGFWLKWIRILVLINKEIIITIHHKVQQDQTFFSTNILFWWREKLLKTWQLLKSLHPAGTTGM